MRRIETIEDKSKIQHRIGLDSYFFGLLTGKVTLLAIDLVKDEWKKLSSLLETTEGIDLGICNCQLRFQYSLPCWHDLLPLYQAGQAIPRSMLHPRWWIDGPILTASKWTPRLIEDSAILVSPRKRDVALLSHQVLAVRDTLPLDQQPSFVETGGCGESEWLESRT